MPAAAGEKTRDETISDYSAGTGFPELICLLTKDFRLSLHRITYHVNPSVVMAKKAEEHTLGSESWPTLWGEN